MVRRLILVIAVALAAMVAVSASAYAPTVPSGLSAYATSGRVALAWQPATGASGYRVYRGASASTITTLVSGGTITATSFADTTVTNASTYFYAVKAVYSGVETSASTPVSAAPKAATCTGTNAIATENCLPGGTGWKISPPADVQDGGIEGFATATSVNAGGSVDLKVNTADNAPYRIEVWRTGWYNGSQGRLVGTLEGLRGVHQDGCVKDDTTGLVDCSNWVATSTLTTTSAWTSGVYLLRLVRTDTGGENHVLLTVRQDGAAHDALYSVPVTTYNAYNDWGGRSLYDWNSSGANTVAGAPRAVKVSFDRPESINRDWYTNTDIQEVSWLERNGYDVAYVTSTDLQAGVPGLTSRKALVFGQHEEYWSTQMRNAAKAARDAGVGLMWTGANAVYWKIRFEASPGSGAANRVQVCYKSTQSGGADPSGDPTGTWRDPAGANSPENALVGVQYIGDKDTSSFPLVVSSDQGKHRIWRYTSLASLPSGTSTQVGDTLVGWEWDARANNGLQPAGLAAIASSPVNGNILQDAGKVYAPGSANQESTYYKAASGATVFATGSMYWSRGLAANMAGVSEPSSAIQQATANALQDMGTRPTTPANVTLDVTGNPTVTGRTPAVSATGVSTTSTVTATFDRVLDPSTVTGAGFTLTPTAGGSPVAATVAYDDATKTATLTPSQSLSANTSYTARVLNTIKGWNGLGVAATVQWSFTTGGGGAPVVSSHVPASNATGALTSGAVTATFDRALTASTVTTSSFTLTPAGGAPVAATVTYDATTRTARLKPSQSLALSQQYTARLTTAITASDGTALAADVTWSFTTQSASCPCNLMTGLTPAATGLPVADGRSGSNLTYELGTKVVADADMAVSAIRFYKSPGETGTHVGRVWSSTGALLGSVTFAGETASGWQQANLSTPVNIAAGQTYVVSVGLNSFFVVTQQGLLTQLSSGPLHSVADGANGVFGSAAGVFPTGSYNSSNYFVDAVVADPTQAPAPPQVSARTPASGATGVARTTTVTATFDQAMDATTITASSFTLKTSGGASVTASVAYDAATRTATLTPTAQLAASTAYTATLTTAVKSSQGFALAAPSTWSFTTVASSAPTVSATTPASGATDVTPLSAVTATFSASLDPTTVDGQSFTLTAAGGAAVTATVSYDDATRTARLAPAAALAPSTSYTATLSSAVRSSDGVAMTAPVSWTFTTSPCPCQLFGAASTPAATGLPTQDGRSGAGPWSYEMGVKIQVSQAARLEAIRFYKSPGETGTHVGRLWSASGTQLATVTFAGESASGWQQANLSTPVALTPGQTYVVSVGVNAYFVMTGAGLQSQAVSGPLASLADGANGVYGNAAGTFPTGSYNSSNYFVDAVVR
jgi:hypothetical protein